MRRRRKPNRWRWNTQQKVGQHYWKKKQKKKEPDSSILGSDVQLLADMSGFSSSIQSPWTSWAAVDSKPLLPSQEEERRKGGKRPENNAAAQPCALSRSEDLHFCYSKNPASSFDTSANIQVCAVRETVSRSQFVRWGKRRRRVCAPGMKSVRECLWMRRARWHLLQCNPATLFCDGDDDDDGGGGFKVVDLSAAHRRSQESGREREREMMFGVWTDLLGWSFLARRHYGRYLKWDKVALGVIGVSH